MNSQSLQLEETLCERNIGYQVIGGTKFFDRAEIKDAIAYLTVLGNPQDVVSFQRVVNSPRRGIGQTSLGRAWSDTRSRWGSASGTPPPTRKPCPASAPPQSVRSGASWRR